MKSAVSNRSISGWQQMARSRTRPAVRAVVRHWAGPACRRARWCGPRCAPAAKVRAGNAVPARETAAPEEIPDEAHGGFPTPPIPKAALITGAARRIGRALALGLAESGYAVAVHHHSSHSAAAELVAQIGRSGGTAIALIADLTDEAAVRRLVPDATAALGP